MTVVGKLLQQIVDANEAGKPISRVTLTRAEADELIAEVGPRVAEEYLGEFFSVSIFVKD